jgi:predicted Zn-dependent protease
MTTLDELDKLATEALTTAKQTGAMPFANTLICVGMTSLLVARIRTLEAREAETRQMLATWRALCEQEQRAREAAEAQLATAREVLAESAEAGAWELIKRARPIIDGECGAHAYWAATKICEAIAAWKARTE